MISILAKTLIFEIKIIYRFLLKYTNYKNYEYSIFFGIFIIRTHLARA